MLSVAAAVLVLCSSGAAFAGEVKLQIRDGLVTLDATNATVRQILSEWARVGQTRIVNIDKAPSTSLTIQLTDVPERQALDVVMRSAGGFIAAPRRTALAAASRFDRILVVPVSTAPVTAAAPPAQPGFRRPPPVVVMDDPDADETGPPFPAEGAAGPTPLMPNMPPPPGFRPNAPGGAVYPGNLSNATPATPLLTPAEQQAAPSAPTPGTLGGSVRPGVILAPPQPAPTPTPTRPPTP
jgi:hypothetical protein